MQSQGKRHFSSWTDLAIFGIDAEHKFRSNPRRTTMLNSLKLLSTAGASRLPRSLSPGGQRRRMPCR
jgi:hypothetical protein